MADPTASKVEELCAALHDEISPGAPISTRAKHFVKAAIQGIQVSGLAAADSDDLAVLKTMRVGGAVWPSKLRQLENMGKKGFPSAELIHVLAELKREPSLLPAAPQAAPPGPPRASYSRPSASTNRVVAPMQQRAASTSTSNNIPPKTSSIIQVQRSTSSTQPAAAGFATPAPTVPAVVSPLPAPDDGFAGFQIFNNRAAAGAPAQAADPLGSMAPYPRNPMYQDADMSPLPRKQEYTPSFSQQLSEAAAASHPQPNFSFTPQHFNLSPTPTPIIPHSIPTHPPSLPTAPAAAPAAPAQTSHQPQIMHTGDLLLPDHMLFSKMTQEAQLFRSAIPARPDTLTRLLQRQASHQLPDTSSIDQLKGSSQDMQEAALVQDLILRAFKGCEGKYIKGMLVQQQEDSQQLRGATFFLPPGALSSSTHEQVSQLLPICEHVLLIGRFISTRKDRPGVVAQAMALQLSSVRDQWWLVLAQLNDMYKAGQLSLQRLAFLCQQPAASLKLFAEVVAEAAHKDLSAAGLLNMLQRRQRDAVGDEEATAQLQRLLQEAAAPYFRILEGWLCGGVLNDACNDFMVQENMHVAKGLRPEDNQVVYWTQRYSIRCVQDEEGGVVQDVPTFLQTCQEQVLTTGKYLNTIRECGQQVVRPLPEDTHLKYDQHGLFQHHIAAAHRAASAALLRFMLREQGLPELLRSMKHFYLLEQGDLVVHLVSQAKEELLKPNNDVNKHRLQSLLELAVKTSSVASDKYADSLSFELDGTSTLALCKSISNSGAQVSGSTSPRLRCRQPEQTDDRSALASFLVKIKLQWPLTLVVSDQHQRRYQVLFRHLFQYKYSAMELAAAWQGLGRPLMQQLRMRAVALEHSDQVLLRSVGHKLLHLVQEYVRYMCQDVLEPLWQAMEGAVAKATNLDEVMQAHDKFLRLAADGMLLTHNPLLLKMSVLHKLAASFSTLVEQLLGSQEQCESSGSTQQQQAAAGAKQLDGQYDVELQALLKLLEGHHAALLQHEGSLGLQEVEEQRQAANCLQTLIDRLTPSKPSAVERTKAELAMG